MGKYIEKPAAIEAITFDELVEYGKANGGNIVNGMPWSFSYNGHPVTHENDACYIVGECHFTPNDMLVSFGTNQIAVLTKDAFEAGYHEICESCEGPLGDDAPAYEDADICCKCHQELLLARAAQALQKAKEVIKAWHGDSGWDIYDTASPEMKNINGALKALGA